MTDLVFDIGGTTWRAAAWDGSGLSRREELEARPLIGTDDPVEGLIRGLEDLGRAVLGASATPDRVGIAFPGPVDERGRVQAAPTLWGEALAASVSLGERVSQALSGAPVTVANDLTAAGYRYLRGTEDYALVTVSSGIGNKVFSSGHPLLGPKHRGGEIGHWRVEEALDAPECDCGGRGHLGAVASGRATPWAFQRAVAEFPELLNVSPLGRTGAPPSNEQLAEAYRAGDPLAAQVVEIGARALGSALAVLHVGVGVERFVIIGGFARALGPDYLHRLGRAAAERSWGDSEEWGFRIEAGEPDDDSGLIGMGRLLDANA